MLNIIIVFGYNAETKEFTDPVQCYPDPRNPSQHILPDHYLEMPPPITAEHEVAVAGEQGWTIEADYRGMVFYDANGTKHEITERGVIPDPAWLDHPPVTIEQQRAQMVVKRGQGRIALLDHGHLDTVETYVASPQCPPRVRIAYQDALEWERLSDTTAAMMLVLGLSDEEADDLFIYAKDVTY